MEEDGEEEEEEEIGQREERKLTKEKSRKKPRTEDAAEVALKKETGSGLGGDVNDHDGEDFGGSEEEENDEAEAARKPAAVERIVEAPSTANRKIIVYLVQVCGRQAV